MPLLKRLPTDRPAPVVLDLTDLGRQAERLREQVRAEADAVLAAAQEAAAGLGSDAAAAGRVEGVEAGRAEGFAAGEQAGREEARAAAEQRLTEAAARWEEAASGVAAVREGIALEAETAVLRLAVALAEKVLARHLETHDDAAVDAVRDAITHVLDPVAATVRVHPADMEVVDAALPGLRPAGGGPVRLEADIEIGRGGCVVDHGVGKIDATVETKLARVAALLLGEDDPAEAAAPDAVASQPPPGVPTPDATHDDAASAPADPSLPDTDPDTAAEPDPPERV